MTFFLSLLKDLKISCLQHKKEKKRIPHHKDVGLKESDCR